MELLERLPDPHFFDGIPKREAELLAVYFFRLPKDPSKEATLKPHIFSAYDPFTRRDVFPVGVRYCVNVYTGCSHGCLYCYVVIYIVHADMPREKEDLIKRAKRDIEEMKALKLPPVPLHISNSSDPFMAEL